jgi:phosphoribosylformylglycinamidine synthase
VSGNVSLYNETKGEAIYPTPGVAMVGLIDDVERHCTQYFKNAGDQIVVLGKNLEELGGSEYLKIEHGLVEGPAPALDLDLEKAVQESCLEAIGAGIIKSAHDCAEGGLAVALAECCISGENMMGANIELDGSGIRRDALLFGESQSRIILTVKKEHLDRLEEIASEKGAPLEVIGEVGGEHLLIDDSINLDIKELHSAWQSAIDQRIA